MPIHKHIYTYNPNAYFYCVILCNACIVIIIFSNVMYFNLFVFIYLFVIVNTPDSIFRDMRCQNKFYLT